MHAKLRIESRVATAQMIEPTEWKHPGSTLDTAS